MLIYYMPSTCFYYIKISIFFLIIKLKGEIRMTKFPDVFITNMSMNSRSNKLEKRSRMNNVIWLKMNGKTKGMEGASSSYFIVKKFSKEDSKK